MLRVAAAQCAPVFLNRAATTERILEWIERASAAGVELLAFGETFLPGYPFWVSRTNGARFEDALQRELFAAYVDQAVDPDGPELREIKAAAKARGIFVVLGLVERARSRGSVYCTSAMLPPSSAEPVLHRKLVPTHEERLVWAPGDAHGIRCVDYRGLRVGTLNCWENWMPLARHTLYSDGCSLLVAVWPGSTKLTQDITRFTAREGRLYVLAASATLGPDDVGLAAGSPLPKDPKQAPYRMPTAARSAIQALGEGSYYDGGSAIAGPDGEFIVAPLAHDEALVIADLDPATVAGHRQSFDATGHYSRPGVFQVQVNRRRLVSTEFHDQ